MWQTAQHAYAGDGLAILVNANAKRGGCRVAAQLRREFPQAELRLTKSIDEIAAWLKSLRDPKYILAAGGDGTSIALLNALQKSLPIETPLPTLGLLPLGTGNAWARSAGARKLGFAVKAIQRASEFPLPTRRYGLVEVEGRRDDICGLGLGRASAERLQKTSSTQQSDSANPSQKACTDICRRCCFVPHRR